MWSRVFAAPIALCLLFLALMTDAQAAHLSRAEAAAWQQDLDFLAASLTRYHVNAFHSISQIEFELRVAALRAQIPHLDRDRAILGLASISALIGDAHTGFGLGTTPPIGFHALPIKVYEYADGVFIQAANPAYKTLVGDRIISVGGVPIAEVLRRLHTVVMSTNEWTFRSQLQFYFKGEIFRALGLSHDKSHVTLAVQASGGAQTRVTLGMIPHPFSVGYRPGPPEGSDWVDSRATTGQPLYLSHLDRFYWYQWLPESRTLYVQCNFILNAQDESFRDFFTRVFATADSLPVQKVVLDLRFNGGGDNVLLPVVIQNLIKRDRLNSAGRLFVVVGRGTQSAAENLVNRLQRDTHAVFVGEPTGERPNEYGDPWPFVLPNSHIELHVASLQWEDIDPRDDRQWTGPDLAAELTSSEYAANVDPAMEVIQSATFAPIEDALAPSLRTGDLARVTEAYNSYLSDPIHKYTQIQFTVEDMAGQLIDGKKYALAQHLLEWNLERNPHSARAMDALCDSHVSTGDVESAKRCFNLVLTLFPRDPIAGSRLSQIDAHQTPHGV
jgi:hypothetical protein